MRVGNQAPRPKLKRPPEHQEEVVVVETAREPEPAKPEPEPAGKCGVAFWIVSINSGVVTSHYQSSSDIKGKNS